MSKARKAPYLFGRRPNPKTIAKNFRSYAAGLGALVYGWNQLHDNLATLFWCVTGIPNGIVPLAIWHSTENDRAQRKMLRAAIDAVAASADAKNEFKSTVDAKKQRKNSRAKEDIKWLVKKADDLAELRNNAIHAPFSFIIGPGPMKMIPNYFQNHPRAKKLKDKELLKEFKFCSDTTAALSLFAKRLNMSLLNPQIPWPDRPQLPSRE